MIFVYLLVAILPLADHHLFGTQYGPLTVFKYIGIGCVLYAIWYLGQRPSPPALFATTQARLFLLLFVLLTASAVRASFSGYSAWPALTSYVSFLLLFFVSMTVIDSPDRLRWTLRFLVASQAISTYYVLKQSLVDHISRPGGAVGDSNYYALCALTAVPIAYCFAINYGHWLERAAHAAALLALLLGITISGSRGGFLGLCAMFVFLTFLSKRPLRNFCLSIILVLPWMVFMPSSPLNRLLHPDYADDIGTDSRTTVWMAGLRMIKTHPLFGIGLATFKEQVENYEDGEKVSNIAHNTFIEITAELGIPALAVFCGILFYSYRSLNGMRRWTMLHGPPLYFNAALSQQAALVGCIVGSVFLTAQYQKNLWMVILSSMFLGPLVQKYRNQKALASKAQADAEDVSGREVSIAQ